MLDGIIDNAPAADSPYIELRKHFHMSKQPVIQMEFREIERILGDCLPWEAYCFETFWYDDTPELSSPLWNSEGFPFNTFRFSEPGHNITTAWTSQGYKIKALRLERNQVIFRREDKSISGVTLPKALTDQRLPEDIIYKFNKLVKQFIKDNGL